jgi:hypothetical protein
MKQLISYSLRVTRFNEGHNYYLCVFIFILLLLLLLLFYREIKFYH